MLITEVHYTLNNITLYIYLYIRLLRGYLNLDSHIKFLSPRDLSNVFSING
jgi:hypothetical protein